MSLTSAPTGFEPALTAPESVSLYGSDLPKRARRDLARAHIGRSPRALCSAGVRQAFRLTLHDRHPSCGEGAQPRRRYGRDLVAEVAVRRRAEPGEPRADPSAGRRPDLHSVRLRGLATTGTENAYRGGCTGDTATGRRAYVTRTPLRPRRPHRSPTLDVVTAFFVALGLEVEGRTSSRASSSTRSSASRAPTPRS